MFHVNKRLIFRLLAILTVIYFILSGWPPAIYSQDIDTDIFKQLRYHAPYHPSPGIPPSAPTLRKPIRVYAKDVVISVSDWTQRTHAACERVECNSLSSPRNIHCIGA